MSLSPLYIRLSTIIGMYMLVGNVTINCFFNSSFLDHGRLNTLLYLRSI